MRIFVKGASTSAAALRGLLAKAGFPLVTALPRNGYTIEIGESEGGPPVFDSVDCEMERRIVSCVTELVKGDVVLRRRGGQIASDREILILVPPDAEVREAVEIGVLRGMLKMFPRPSYESEPVTLVPEPPPPPPVPVYNRRQRFFRWLAGGPLV